MTPLGPIHPTATIIFRKALISKGGVDTMIVVYPMMVPLIVNREKVKISKIKVFSSFSDSMFVISY
jgi:hypothetical protein